jgi:uncharacterized damage-inducible protein DinB
MTQTDALFKSQSFHNLAAVRLKWSEIEKEQTEFVDQVTDELLEKKLPFRTTEVRLAHLMQHVTNHSTYHRGQAALMMRQLASEPAATDFHVFLPEGRRTGAEPTQKNTSRAKSSLINETTPSFLGILF